MDQADLFIKRTQCLKLESLLSCTPISLCENSNQSFDIPERSNDRLSEPTATSSLSLRLKYNDDPWHIEQETFTILNFYLQLKSAITAATAVAALDVHSPMKREAQPGEEVEVAESFLMETYSTFIGIARQIPHDHPSQDRLVELIKALTELPPTEVVVWEV